MVLYVKRKCDARGDGFVCYKFAMHEVMVLYVIKIGKCRDLSWLSMRRDSWRSVPTTCRPPFSRTCTHQYSTNLHHQLRIHLHFTPKPSNDLVVQPTLSTCFTSTSHLNLPMTLEYRMRFCVCLIVMRLPFTCCWKPTHLRMFGCNALTLYMLLKSDSFASVWLEYS